MAHENQPAFYNLILLNTENIFPPNKAFNLDPILHYDQQSHCPAVPIFLQLWLAIELQVTVERLNGMHHSTQFELTSLWNKN